MNGKRCIGLGRMTTSTTPSDLVALDAESADDADMKTVAERAGKKTSVSTAKTVE